MDISEVKLPAHPVYGKLKNQPDKAAQVNNIDISRV